MIDEMIPTIDKTVGELQSCTNYSILKFAVGSANAKVSAIEAVAQLNDYRRQLLAQHSVGEVVSADVNDNVLALINGIMTFCLRMTKQGPLCIDCPMSAQKASNIVKVLKTLQDAVMLFDADNLKHFVGSKPDEQVVNDEYPKEITPTSQPLPQPTPDPEPDPEPGPEPDEPSDLVDDEALRKMDAWLSTYYPSEPLLNPDASDTDQPSADTDGEETGCPSQAEEDQALSKMDDWLEQYYPGANSQDVSDSHH